jgi:hypothetical protein
MNRRLTTVVTAVALLLAAAPCASARPHPDPAMITADAVIVRPVGAVVVVACAAVFVVALPFAAIANQVPQTADNMVGKPARAIFGRPLGDFTRMRNHSVGHTPAAER